MFNLSQLFRSNRRRRKGALKSATSAEVMECRTLLTFAGFGDDHVLIDSQGGPRSNIAVADFNGDGHDDLVTVVEEYSLGRNNGGLEIWSGNHRGEFSRTNLLETGGRSHVVEVGDFNGDGVKDVVTGTRTASGTPLQIFYGQTRGGFSSAVAVDQWSEHMPLIVADFNSDGRDDLAFGRFNGRIQETRIGLSDGNGRPQLAWSHQFGTQTVHHLDGASMVAADINEDGRTDLVVATTNDVLHLVTQQSQGGFHVSAHGSSGGHADVLLRDVNGDNDPDLIVASGATNVRNGNDIVIRPGRRGASFGPASRYFAGATVGSIAAADMNGDGNIDIVAANKHSDDIRWFQGVGDGTFSTSESFAAGPRSIVTQPSDIIVMDVNKDGTLDAVVAHDKSFVQNSSISSFITAVYGVSERVESSSIEIYGNGLQRISPDDRTPSAADNTLFPSTYVNGSVVEHVFGMANGGDGELKLTGTPLVQVLQPNGALSTEFRVTQLPPRTLTRGTAQWKIAFDPAEVGVRTAVVRIENNDPHNGSFEFTVRGEGIENLQHPNAPVVTAPVGTVSSRRPEFRWDAGDTAESFEIWVANISTRAFRLIHESGLKGKTFAPKFDLNNGVHRVWVRAHNSVGASKWSEPADFTVGTRVTLPGRPVLSGPASESKDTQPKITWTHVENADVYDLWVNNLTTGRAQVIREEALTSASFTPSDEFTAGRYVAWVRAKNDAGAGAWSRGHIFTISAPVPTPEKVRVTGPQQQTSDATPEIQWKGAAHADYYEVYVFNRASWNIVAQQSNVSTLSFTPSQSLPPGGYQVYVRAHNSTGAGHWSEGYRFDVVAAKPGTVEILSPSSTVVSKFPRFSWTSASHADRYEVLVLNMDTWSTTIHEKSIDVENFQSRHAFHAGNYRVWVRAVSATGVFGDWSKSRNFVVRSA